MPDDEEPTFVLRAGDPLAADLVALWADRAVSLGVPAEKVADVVELSERMRTWRRSRSH